MPAATFVSSNAAAGGEFAAGPMKVNEPEPARQLQPVAWGPAYPSLFTGYCLNILLIALFT